MYISKSNFLEHITTVSHCNHLPLLYDMEPNLFDTSVGVDASEVNAWALLEASDSNITCC